MFKFCSVSIKHFIVWLIDVILPQSSMYAKQKKKKNKEGKFQFEIFLVDIFQRKKKTTK